MVVAASFSRYKPERLPVSNPNRARKGCEAVCRRGVIGLPNQACSSRRFGHSRMRPCSIRNFRFEIPFQTRTGAWRFANASASVSLPCRGPFPSRSLTRCPILATKQPERRFPIEFSDTCLFPLPTRHRIFAPFLTRPIPPLTATRLSSVACCRRACASDDSPPAATNSSRHV